MTGEEGETVCVTACFNVEGLFVPPAWINKKKMGKNGKILFPVGQKFS
jgi:hypothetical protein